MNEVVALAQQRLARRPRQRVSEAIAKIELGGMSAALAVVAIGSAGARIPHAARDHSRICRDAAGRGSRRPGEPAPVRRDHSGQRHPPQQYRGRPAHPVGTGRGPSRAGTRTHSGKRRGAGRDARGGTGGQAEGPVARRRAHPQSVHSGLWHSIRAGAAQSAGQQYVALPLPPLDQFVAPMPATGSQAVVHIQ